MKKEIIFIILLLDFALYKCLPNNITSTYKIYNGKTLTTSFQTSKPSRIIEKIGTREACTTRCHFIRTCKTALYNKVTYQCILYSQLADLSDTETGPSFAVFSKISN
jgi:hypothetical protein